MSSEEKILEVEHLFVTLDSRQILRDISFSLRRGKHSPLSAQMAPVRLYYSEHCWARFPTPATCGTPALLMSFCMKPADV